MKTLLIPVAAAMLAATAVSTEVQPAKHDARGSHNGRYVVSAVVEANDRWRFQVADSTGYAVKGASVYAFASMPVNGRSGSLHMRAAEFAGGDYRVHGLELDRPGWWNVALVISSKAGTDSVAFNVNR